MRCERCVKACRNQAIYFKNSIRLVNYNKCKGCLNCVQVCPRNAIEVTSVVPQQVLTVKIDHEKCTMCKKCVDDKDKFCPNDLFFIGNIKKNGKVVEGIKFKFNEVNKCQGCLKCESLCPEKAIKPIQFKV